MKVLTITAPMKSTICNLITTFNVV